MKSIKIIIPAVSLLIMQGFIYAQSPPGGKAIDEIRLCKDLENQKKKGADKFVYPESVIDSTNYEERVQKEEMTNLLIHEITRIKETISNIERKHAALAKLYPHIKNYQEITLENNPGEWEQKDFYSHRKVVAFHYSGDDKLACIVIDSEKKNVHYDSIWQRKIIRLYIPYIQSMEMESLGHHSRKLETMDNATPEMQLQGLKIISRHLQESLYSIDLMIASYYNKKEKRNPFLIIL